MRYEIRALSGAEILDTSFRVLRNHFVLLVGITASVYLPLAIVLSLIGEATERGPSDTAFMTVLVGIGAVAVLATIGGTLVFTAVTHAIAELYSGHTVTWRQALARAQREFVRVVGTTLLFALFCLLGFLLFVLPGVYLALSGAILWPVMLIERRFGMQAIRRSRDLMRGNLLRALGVLVVVWLVSAAIGTGLTLPVAAIPSVQTAVSGLVQAVTTTYGAIVTVLLYFDVRCRKEAFDLEHLARLVAGTDPGAVPA